MQHCHSLILFLKNFIFQFACDTTFASRAAYELFMNLSLKLVPQKISYDPKKEPYETQPRTTSVVCQNSKQCCSNVKKIEK